jgi:hypothetical protein
MNIDIAKPYTPAECERGKFTKINEAFLTSMGYPSGGYGRYAVLTYDINSGVSTLSGIPIDNTIPNTIWVGSSAFPSETSLTSDFANPLAELEIQNRSNGSVFLILDSYDYTDTIELGIEIAVDGYYSTKKTISAFTVASVSGGDIRMIGHYVS